MLGFLILGKCIHLSLCSAQADEVNVEIRTSSIANFATSMQFSHKYQFKSQSGLAMSKIHQQTEMICLNALKHLVLRKIVKLPTGCTFTLDDQLKFRLKFLPRGADVELPTRCTFTFDDQHDDSVVKLISQDGRKQSITAGSQWRAGDDCVIGLTNH